VYFSKSIEAESEEKSEILAVETQLLKIIDTPRHKIDTLITFLFIFFGLINK
jgi:hypothetical protein